MYLHLGQNEIIPQRRVIGIFDLDKCSYEKRTRDYLAAARRRGWCWTSPGICPGPSWCATTRIMSRLCI